MDGGHPCIPASSFLNILEAIASVNVKLLMNIAHLTLSDMGRVDISMSTLRLMYKVVNKLEPTLMDYRAGWGPETRHFFKKKETI